ncbi:MAG: prolyl oligopeptidase family serine peptidase [Flavobacteriales bacterium]|nr:prolyl oligopeptidase family serine peptidase [Flavobacteriales bacterium]
MKKILLFGSIAFALSSCGGEHKKDPPARMKIEKYPETKKVEQQLDFFGTTVSDPYIWLENDTSAETGAWVDAQIAVTRNYLDSIPYRDKIAARFRDLFNFEKVGAPMKAGDYYFIFKNSGLEPQGKYFVRKGLEGTDELFLDINTIAENGLASASLLGADDQNRYMAVNVNQAGSDWSTIEVYDIATKQKMSDKLEWVKFSGAAWYGDGFYYSRYPQPAKGMELSGDNKNHMVYYHKIGTPQAADELVYSDPARQDMYHNVYLTEDKKYLFLVAAPGTDTYEVWYKNPAEKTAKFKPLFTDMNHKSSPIESTEDGMLIVRTDVGSANSRLVLVDPAQPDPANWKEIVAPTENLLQNASTGGGVIFLEYLDKANTRIFRCNYDGSDLKEIPMPDKTGSAGGFGGKKDEKICFYSFTSFTYPSVIFKYDIDANQSTEYYRINVKFNPSDYESKQVMYKSKDGTDVPMFIVHKKGLKLDGKNPAWLYSYGGFSVPMQPGFSSSRIILLENGAVFAMPCIRGGNEFGEDWHKGGMLDKKQNVFDDFISAAEYLIKEGYTSHELLAIEGGSNGGLLVGACMTQRPELFKVAFPQVGVLDMLRFHKFTVGKGWIPEYGCADSSKTQFEYLFKYSPYHNLKKGTKYPATMVMTADHDDRVVPAHSFKFAARLQEYHQGEHPVLIRIEKSAGHGAGMSTDQVIESIADKYAFFFYNIGRDL